MRAFRSPIPYMGNKFKLMKDLLQLFPQRCNVFVDLFGGSGVVSMNYQGKVKTIYNEFNHNIVEMVKMFVDNDPDELDAYFKSVIEKYNLRQSSVKEECREGKDDFLRYREYYNSSENKDYRDLFLLSCYSINHLIRFNYNDEFNVSNGSCSYNENNYECVKDMHERFSKVEILNIDAFDFDFDSLTENDFVYCDPPYLNTEAVYNEKRAFGGWDISCDERLFKILEELNNRNVKWGLSNVFENRGITNQHLIKWCNKNGWKVYHLERNYNPFSMGNSDNDEVYVCNYDTGVPIIEKEQLW